MKNNESHSSEKKELIKNVFFDEQKFMDFIDMASKEGILSNEKKRRIFRSLQESDAKERLKVWMMAEPLGFMASILMATAVTGGAAATGAFAGIKTYLLTEGTVGIGRNLFVRHKGKNLPDKNRLANIATVPFGVWAIPLSLHKKHPDLVEGLLFYGAAKRKSKEGESLDPASPEYELWKDEMHRRYERIKNGIMITVLSKVNSVLKKKPVHTKTPVARKKPVPRRNTFVSAGMY